MLPAAWTAMVMCERDRHTQKVPYRGRLQACAGVEAALGPDLRRLPHACRYGQRMCGIWGQEQEKPGHGLPP